MQSVVCNGECDCSYSSVICLWFRMLRFGFMLDQMRRFGLGLECESLT